VPIARWHYRYQQIHRFSLAFMGHFHTSDTVQNHIVMNGCLCGGTGYTTGKALRSSECQTLCIIDEVDGLDSVQRLYYT
jgi:hypothetical protein